jgi:hypothetical protein
VSAAADVDGSRVVLGSCDRNGCMSGRSIPLEISGRPDELECQA